VEGLRISVVAPVFNEEDVIRGVIEKWAEILRSTSFDPEIILTDDGSCDRTPEILNALQDRIDFLKVIRHERNGGYGRALQSAIKNSTGDYIVTIDSDGQFDLSEFKILYKKLETENLDCVTGYRKNKSDSLIRVVADRILNLVVRVLFGLNFRDTNCALKICKGNLIRAVSIEAMGYPAPTELLIRLSKSGAKIGEMGINHFQRSGGSSKLKVFGVGYYMLLFLIFLRFKIFLFDRKVIQVL